ncbi:MAG: endonuclease/exonuclease/phosphatase family protein [Candidatus Thiodiazotropha taylori]|nr:endonuclease/exonuclease/phosphatase family protein [Candidatus Thiodiazotropha taylori]MCW4335450.1 reverse transcriptase domain-containing protein [Candidatus Thiodiazotropha endolucinida]
MVPNLPYLQVLAKTGNILCLQETWLWHYEKDNLKLFLPDFDFYARCADSDSFISNFNAPRGKAGVAILWPIEISKHIRKLQDGNSRTVAIEIGTDDGLLCIVNCYMPSLNTGSTAQYLEHLDVLQSIIDRYSVTHQILICGDFNGTLLQSRSNPHDKLLRSFCQENNLISNTETSEKCTFFHHSGKSSSQIDYALSKSDSGIVSRVNINDMHELNTSSHVPVTIVTNQSRAISIRNKSSKTIHPTKRLQWDKLDKDKFQKSLINSLNSVQLQSVSTEDRVDVLSELLHTAARRSVPSVANRLRGPKRRASPKVRELMKLCKSAHVRWKYRQDNSIADSLFLERKLAKKALRTQVRFEKSQEKDNMISELMSNPSSKLFHKIVRRNRSDSSSTSTQYIKYDGKELYDPIEQVSAFKAFYEDLAMPKQESHFDQEYADEIAIKYEHIKLLCKESGSGTEVLFVASDIEKAISKLNTGKSADESGLHSEHFKAAGRIVVPLLVILFNDILRSGSIPKSFKSGILTPVHKKDKDPTLLDNYRGITVTATLGKIFEYALLNKLLESGMNSNQSELQIGFSEGLSPGLGSLFLSEAAYDAHVRQVPLYIAPMDSQKAFDKQDHKLTLCELYAQGVGGSLWTVVCDLYEGLTSRVKWQEELSEPFPVLQGVRQGGVLSPHLYKMYINPLLLDLEMANLGVFVGTVYTGCPTCADDLLLMSNYPAELQLMLSKCFRNSGRNKCTFHPCKSCIIRHNVNARQLKSETVSTWTLGTNPMSVKENSEHLGLIRGGSFEGQANVTNRISLARRTLYSLIKTGMHGSNGLNPKVSYKMYQCYVLPRLLFGLETIFLLKKHIKMLSDFHLDTLRKLQALPNRTSCAAVLLLLGALPLEAELDKRHLSLLFSCLKSGNSKLVSLATRQSLFYDSEGRSFFTRVHCMLDKYGLPGIDSICNLDISKDQWKIKTKCAIRQYWSEKLRLDAYEKSTLKYCNIPCLQIGQTHHVWDSIESTRLEVRRGVIKCRIVTGTYIVQTLRSKFNQYQIDSTCPLCRAEDEDIEHMLLRCSALHSTRKEPFKKLKDYIVGITDINFWRSFFSNKENLIKLIIDCSQLTELQTVTNMDILTVERLSRNLCFALHTKRLNKLNEG